MMIKVIKISKQIMIVNSINYLNKTRSSGFSMMFKMIIFSSNKITIMIILDLSFQTNSKKKIIKGRKNKNLALISKNIRILINTSLIKKIAIAIKMHLILVRINNQIHLIQISILNIRQ